MTNHWGVIFIWHEPIWHSFFTFFNIRITGYDRTFPGCLHVACRGIFSQGLPGLKKWGCVFDQLQVGQLSQVLHWGKGRTLFCFTFLKAFPGQCCFGRSVHLGCWVAASHLVLKLEWVRSCQRLDWEIWMQAGNSSNSFSQIGTVRKTLENHNYFRQNTKFASFLNIM